MTDSEVSQWLQGIFMSSYQNKGASEGNVTWDLTKITHFANYLNSPETQFKSIHVGGTNGKGSTSHIMASILQEAGYKVGLFTSPHLKDFRERIRINGQMIPHETVAQFVKEHHNYIDANQLSFFEFTVGLAFFYFAEEKVDIAIVEVGMGGRLDSTNILRPEVSVITNIGMDHTQFLGETLPQIASEKAGIIKKKVSVVIGEYHEETFSVFQQKATACDAELYLAEKTISKNYPTDLLGSYQQKNSKTAVQAIRLLKDFTIQEEHIEKGVLNVVKNTNLLGRWQILSEKPKIICDTAHNREGLLLTMTQLQKEDFEKLHIVFGVMKDKKLDEIFSFFPKNAIYYFAQPKNERALPAFDLQEKARHYKLYGNIYNSVSAAYAAAQKRASSKDVIYIGGSTFVVAEIL